jgi:hypothetical protein
MYKYNNNKEIIKIIKIIYTFIIFLYINLLYNNFFRITYNYFYFF